MATATTETVKEPETGPEELASPIPYRMSVDVYDKIVDAGVFGDKSPIYLWKGQLVLPMTKGPYHEFSVTILRDLLSGVLPEGWHVRQGSPTRLGDDSEPEPDLSVVRGSARDYKSRHPARGDVALTIEVADSSRKFDEGEKLKAYAAEAMPVYWVVNIPETCINVYTRPTGPCDEPGYRGHQRFGPEDQVAVILDDREVGRIAAKDVLE